MGKKYIAYGSNMNIEQMSRRCPNAKPIGKTVLKNYKLVFKGVADIEKSESEEVPIVVWEITKECEKALDIYEGYPRLYRKEYVQIEINGKTELAMVYVMNYAKGAKPSEYYYNIIKQGYKDFNIDTTTLKRALAESKRKER